MHWGAVEHAEVPFQGAHRTSAQAHSAGVAVEQQAMQCMRAGGSSAGGPSSLDARAKRSAMTLSEMVAKADAGPGGSGDASRPTDSSLHSSSKRTRTSNGTALHPSTAGADAPSVAGGQSPSMHTNLTGPMEAFGVGDGGGSTHGRSRRSRVRLPDCRNHTQPRLPSRGRFAWRVCPSRAGGPNFT